MTPPAPFVPDLVRRGAWRGVDLAAMVAAFWRLDALRVVDSEKRRPPEVRWRAYRRGCAWGTARPAFRHVTLRLGPYGTVEHAAEVVLHEVVHCACPLGEQHGELFCRRLVAAAREAFGLDLDVAALLALPADSHGRRAYSIDAAIVAAAEAAGVGEKLVERFPYVAPARPSAEELREARVADRETKAREKLAEWEKKAAAARRIAARWRRRVRYYERKHEKAAKAPEKT